MTEHTAGPLHIRETACGDVHILTEDDYLIGAALWRTRTGPGEEPEIKCPAKANAALWIAAPALLAACEAIVAYTTRGEGAGWRVTEMAEAAIRKAKGG